MKLGERFKVVEFKNPSGTTVYRVTGRRVNGVRVRQNFPTPQEAIQRKAELETEELNEKQSVRLRSTCLNETQLRQAEAAMIKLEGKSVIEAVEFYISHYREPITQKPLPEAYAEFIDAKKRSGKRELTIKNLRLRVGSFVGRHGGAQVAEIAGTDVDAYLRAGKVSIVTRNNNRRALSGFFNWCHRQGYCERNPVDQVEVFSVDRGEPEILTLRQVQALLREAGELIPYVALGLFAGIRPRELQLLTWDDVDLEEKLVTIGSKIAKKRQRRHVEISDNLLAWLLPARAAGLPIYPANWRKRFDQVKAAAKIKQWPVDVMRHTYISNHLAEHQNEGRTAAEAGNSPDVIHTHYRNLVKPKDAKTFWKITPDSGSKVVSFSGNV